MPIRPLRRPLLLAGLALLGALTAFGWSLTRGNARSLPRAPYPVAAPVRHWQDWPEVFSGAERVELTSLDTGLVHVSRTRMLAASHPLRGGYSDPQTPLTVFAHLIEHPRAGAWLVDTGLDASFRDEPYGNITAPARWVLATLMDAPYSQVRGQDVVSQLSARNAHPHSVFFTHLHMDHTAGLPALTPEVRLVTGVGEAEDWIGYFGFGHLANAHTWFELSPDSARQMPELGPCVDVFGDGSFWAVFTPGHSDGHLSYLVNAQAGPVLLTGDAAHFDWAFEHGVGPDGSDPQAAQSSLDRLKAFASRYPQIRVHTGHEAPRSAVSASLPAPVHP